MMKMNAVRFGCGAMAGAALVLAAAVQVRAADLHSVLTGEEKDYSIVYLDGRTFGSGPRVLTDRHVYIVTNTVNFTGRDGSDGSIAGESGLTVADKAVVYIYIAAGAKLTCTGGNGRDASVGGVAPAPGYKVTPAENEGVRRNTYPFVKSNLSAGGGGTGAGGGGAGILVPNGSKLAVFGPGQLVATGGKGGNAAVGGQGSKGLYAAATWYISYAGTLVASSPYKTFGSNIGGATAGWSGTTTSGTVGCDCNAQPGAGGGGGGGAGGGGAAIGSAGASGSAGAAGGVNADLWNDVVGASSGEKQLKPKRAPSDPSSGESSALVGEVFFGVNFKPTLTFGSGGGVSGSQPPIQGDFTCKCYTYNTIGGVVDYYLYFTEGQAGGAGGTGGNGCEIGRGGNGGVGGKGGDSGSLADSLWGKKSGPAGTSNQGTAGGKGGGNTPDVAQGLPMEKQPYGKISFTDNEPKTYCFGRVNQIDVPSPKQKVYLGWRVATPLEKALPGVPDNAHLLANDSTFYREGGKVELACGVAGDATLTAWTLTVQDGGAPMPFDIRADDDAYKTYLSKETTLKRMNEVLATRVKNKLPLWQDLVLGFAPEDSTAAIRLSIAVSNNPARVWIDAPSLSKRTDRYAVVPVFLPLSKSSGGNWTERTKDQKSKLPLSLDVPSESREDYKMSITFKSKE